MFEGSKGQLTSNIILYSEVAEAAIKNRRN
jgi:hypothetical protein